VIGAGPQSRANGANEFAATTARSPPSRTARRHRRAALAASRADVAPHSLAQFALPVVVAAELRIHPPVDRAWARLGPSPFRRRSRPIRPPVETGGWKFGKSAFADSGAGTGAGGGDRRRLKTPLGHAPLRTGPTPQPRTVCEAPRCCCRGFHPPVESPLPAHPSPVELARIPRDYTPPPLPPVPPPWYPSLRLPTPVSPSTAP
jgi:hypothetical protein